ncbi:MAG: ABC transporter ATP-binding protein/permease, partial [Bacteroidales bacterium]|nr:ABC transporter ATP-binding protein/permease [Bacteroidales bacterium]
GDILSRMGSDVFEVEWSIFASLQSLCRDPFLIIAFLVALFSISVKLTLISLVIMPLLGYLLATIGKNIKQYSLRSQQLLGKMSSFFEEAVGGLRVIPGYNAMDHASDRFRNENFRFYRLNKKIFRINELGAPLIEFLCILALMVITLVGLIFFPSEALGNGSVFMLYFVVFARLIVPAKALVTTYYTLQKGLSAAGRVYEIIDAEEKIVECPNPIRIQEIKDKIEYKNVSFAYHDVKNEDECDVLHHINFTLPKGKTIAIVGPSGSGKSTIVDLLPRFYDVPFGEILIDGIPNDQYAIADLRSIFGIVNQDVILFNDTVYHNIAFGMKEVTEEQVVAAAKIAQAHDFIMEMENGYQTVLGDRGTRLSGGQRQRISIARAILSNPQVLILDEATSALDNESEYLFQEALIPLIKERTAVIIAHRLSTIRFADTILFVKNGSIVEQGSHDELIALKGEYYHFYTAQS